MLPIGTFSKLSNVTTKTLRYYDEINLLKPMYVNSENNYRFYSVDQLSDVLLINRLKKYLFSLEEISEVLTKQYDDIFLYKLIKQKQENIENNISDFNTILQQMNRDISKLERGLSIMSHTENLDIKLIETNPQTILYVREKLNVDDYGKLMGKLYEKIYSQKLKVLGAPLTIYHDMEYNPNNYDMEVAIPIEQNIDGTRVLDGGLCVIGTLKGPYSELPSMYAKMSQWIEKEGYEIAGPTYEIYLTDPHTNISPDDYVTEVYFPVKVK